MLPLAEKPRPSRISTSFSAACNRCAPILAMRALSWRQAVATAPTDRALADSPESIPKEMMRVGWMRTMVSSNRSFRALPPSATTAAVPRISIARGYQDGSTSKIRMLDQPVLELVLGRVFVEE